MTFEKHFLFLKPHLPNTGVIKLIKYAQHLITHAERTYHKYALGGLSITLKRGHLRLRKYAHHLITRAERTYHKYAQGGAVDALFALRGKSVEST